MIKRTITISSPVHLSLENRQLVMTNKETEERQTLPLAEVGLLILEHPRVTTTLRMLQYCMEVGCVVVVCDQWHIPSGYLYPLEGHSTQGERTREQVAASIPTKKSIWKQLVKSKILNQAAVLKSRGIEEYQRLLNLADDVRSGDPDNREGIAARIYWSALLGEDFIRGRDGAPPNALFNYAYAILRASVTRSIIASGLSPKLGVQHQNKYNPFPLSDDVMEPYRPFADLAVMELVDSGEPSITKESRAHLRTLLAQDTLISKLKRPLLIAISITTSSLARVYSGGAKTLVLPRIP